MKHGLLWFLLALIVVTPALQLALHAAHPDGGPHSIHRLSLGKLPWIAGAPSVTPILALVGAAVPAEGVPRLPVLAASPFVPPRP